MLVKFDPSQVPSLSAKMPPNFDLFQVVKFFWNSQFPPKFVLDSGQSIRMALTEPAPAPAPVLCRDGFDSQDE